MEAAMAYFRVAHGPRLRSGRRELVGWPASVHGLGEPIAAEVIDGFRRRAQSLGCSTGCGGGRCGLGEWYVRDEEEDDTASTSTVGLGCDGSCSCGRCGPTRLGEQYVRDDDNDVSRSGT